MFKQKARRTQIQTKGSKDSDPNKRLEGLMFKDSGPHKRLEGLGLKPTDLKSNQTANLQDLVLYIDFAPNKRPMYWRSIYLDHNTLG